MFTAWVWWPMNNFCNWRGQLLHASGIVYQVCVVFPVTAICTDELREVLMKQGCNRQRDSENLHSHFYNCFSLLKCQSRQSVHWDTFKQDNYSTVGRWGDVGSARYEPSLLPPCPTISVLSDSICQRSTQSISKWIFRNVTLSFVCIYLAGYTYCITCTH